MVKFPHNHYYKDVENIVNTENFRGREKTKVFLIGNVIISNYATDGYKGTETGRQFFFTYRPPGGSEYKGQPIAAYRPPGDYRRQRTVPCLLVYLERAGMK